MLKRRLNRKIKRAKRNLTSKTDVTLKYRKLNIDIERRSRKIINLVGYIILFLVFLDYGFLLASAQVFEPTWSYNTAGKLVENVWGLFLALVFIFYRCDQDIVKPKESLLLKIISWLSLAIAIGYFLITPVIVVNGFRVYRGNKAQITNQIDLQKTQVEQYTKQLHQANKEQLSGLLQQYATEQSSFSINTDSSDEIKKNILAIVQKEQKQAQQQLETEFSQKKNNLVQKTIKWSIGASVSGICFGLIWRNTKWARKF